MVAGPALLRPILLVILPVLSLFLLQKGQLIPTDMALGVIRFYDAKSGTNCCCRGHVGHDTHTFTPKQSVTG